MCKRLVCTFLLSIIWIPTSSQDSIVFGELTYQDKTFKAYEKDPDAPAVVLYEKGEVFFIVKDKRLYLIKTFHTKIKVLDKEGFAYGNVSVPLLVSNNVHEDIADIKAITHNNGIKTHLLEENVYPSNTQQGVLDIKFSLPNVQIGSILEYKYMLLSPFFFNLDGWEFQGFIPKLYSEFNALIPLKYVYNRALIGEHELCTNEVEKVDSCFIPPGGQFRVTCEYLTYAMEDIPAFKSNGSFMLGSSNYISRLDFELSKINGYNQGTKFTTSWTDVDKEYKSDKNIGKQLRYKGFFGRQIPDHLLNGTDELVKATNIYNFIRDHYTWNGGFGIYGEARVKEAFKERKGNVAEINMSLINLLNSAGIKTNLMLMSPRQLGLPKKTYPVMTDFNYIIAKTTLNGVDYLLDATSKHHPFGILPFHALNHYGRVMDFSDASYWHEIKPYEDNKYQLRCQARFEPETQRFLGQIDIVRTGYNATELRELKDQKSEADYLNLLNQQTQNNLEITSYEQVTSRSDDRKVSERLLFELESFPVNDKIYFNPFLLRFFEKDPFVDEERTYPIDFGYPRNYKYQINITIPKGYDIESMPEKRVVQLGENIAYLKFFSTRNENAVMISFDLIIDHTYFEPADYQVLKELYKQSIDAQNNSLIVLKKI